MNNDDANGIRFGSGRNFAKSTTENNVATGRWAGVILKSLETVVERAASISRNFWRPLEKGVHLEFGFSAGEDLSLFLESFNLLEPQQ